jgi:hypothetical protein
VAIVWLDVIPASEANVKGAEGLYVRAIFEGQFFRGSFSRAVFQGLTQVSIGWISLLVPDDKGCQL